MYEQFCNISQGRQEKSSIKVDINNNIFVLCLQIDSRRVKKRESTSRIEWELKNNRYEHIWLFTFTFPNSFHLPR